MLGVLGLIPQGSAEEPKLTATQRHLFENKIRPLLVQNCYKCHSVEEGKAKGGLTLDTRDGWLKGGSDGPVIVPGDPDKSILIQAVRYTDPDLQMPPKGPKLSDEQIADLTFWVKIGAPDPRIATADAAAKMTELAKKPRAHWSYQAIQKPAVPAVKNKRWISTPVDAFVLAKLEEKKMLPSVPASREALIRRVYYDLIGLPPSPAEVQAFVYNGSSQAYANLVERLLASPQYGERWGRHWLDTARYADTRGGDNNRAGEDYRYAHAWTYRDYVIDAFNKDKPYDQFIIEQLAADKLPDIEQDKTRLAALGFLTVGERFNNVNDVINDRIDVVSKGFLGMTVTCARCHDHKFDPIPTADYYSLHGVFASSIEPEEKPLLRPVQNTAAYLDYQQKYTALEQQNLLIYYRTLDTILSDFRQKVGEYLTASVTFRDLNDSKTVKRRTEFFQQTKINPELLREMGRVTRRKDNPVFGPLRLFAELSDKDYPQRGREIAIQIATNKQVNPLVANAFKNAAPRSMLDVIVIYKNLFASLETRGKEFIVASATAKSARVPGFDAATLQLLEIPFTVQPAAGLDSYKLRATVRNWPRRIMEDAKFVFNQMNELELTHPGAPPRAMALLDAKQPKNSPILVRGEAQNRGPVVPRQSLEIISGSNRQPFSDGSGRLELARAIASKDNPLTARVMMNRVWMHHFGEGFVPTPDDLGTQAEAPSHPELLDYLAARFIEEGWSLKKMHRLIVLSSAYQQSSDTNPAYEQTDPQNRLLWRANIRRLDFEAQRDSLLAFSGQLDRRLGGQPANITSEPYSYRRSVYGYIDRGNLPELMTHFDFSDPDMPNSKRTTTVVPQQALFLMNSPLAVDVARKIVARDEVSRAPTDLARIWAIYQIIFQRLPRTEEVRVAERFLGLEIQDGIATAKALPQTTANNNNSRNEKKSTARASTQAVTAMPAMPAMTGRQDPRKPVQNQGARVDRGPLTVWEEFTQALLLANEAAYVN